LMKVVQKKSRLGRLTNLLDKLTFGHILIIWTGILAAFGLAYYFFSGPNSHLIYSLSKERVTSLSDSVYFSFITATSTGFGDLTPIGYFKVISIVEVIFGLVLLAIVTSKLVSIKQDVIMNEIYDISFNEKINRIRSSLLLFRQNLSRVISNIENNTIRHREISDLYNYISSLDDNLHEISNLFNRGDGDGFKKELDPMSAELLFHSINQSFEKLYELIALMNNNNIEWKRKITVDLINGCIKEDSELFEMLHKARNVPEKDYIDLSLHNKKVVEQFKSCVESPDGVCEFDIEKLHGAGQHHK
jgi:potassium channel LctB